MDKNREPAERRRVAQLHTKERQVKTQKLREQSASLAKQAEDLEGQLAKEAANEKSPGG